MNEQQQQQRPPPPDISQISGWRSIITLVVFVVTNIIVSFPFHIPIPVPRILWEAFLGALSKLRIIPPRDHAGQSKDDARGHWVTLRLSISTITAPVYACLFLLAILAIGRTEVYDGTIGSDNIEPYDVMIFFITLAYIAISIDASGLLRFLAFKVLQKGGAKGHRLFLYLYCFFFTLGAAIGNDPIVLSGTAFLAYMIRASSNIASARAWVFSQFAIANISSAILVSSNPTNLVLAGAFQIKFIDYTANIIVPVLFTAAILFPCLLYIVFRNEKLVPHVIDMHTLPDAEKEMEPVNANIPHAGAGEDRSPGIGEILNPYLDRRHATISVGIMAATLITVLVINAVTAGGGGHPTPVMYVTAPAAVLCFSADLFFGWRHRHTTRAIAQKGRLAEERATIEQELRESASSSPLSAATTANATATDTPTTTLDHSSSESTPPSAETHAEGAGTGNLSEKKAPLPWDADAVTRELERRQKLEAEQPTTLVSWARRRYTWWRETFPAASIVMSRLPFELVPFAFAMFILVQGLVTRGWVPVFAYGWDAWIKRTGVVGAIGGMGFLGVVLSNFTGTNIGTTILLCRIMQAWQQILASGGRATTDRTFWGAVYGMALGVNYGAFSSALCASLAGLLWRDILLSKGVIVRRLEFLRINAPIIAIATAVGCAVLVGEIYIMRKDTPFVLLS
ncbi:arsenite transmembrane transporter protein [Apiospora arundinis]|uniref:Arsenite transmembrane transporter protein n=1 Tax=Apiospora arundinis TaxID=335852 RepID=A0ABR2IRL0_9PEZI